MLREKISNSFNSLRFFSTVFDVCELFYCSIQSSGINADSAFMAVVATRPNVLAHSARIFKLISWLMPSLYRCFWPIVTKALTQGQIYCRVRIHTVVYLGGQVFCFPFLFFFPADQKAFMWKHSLDFMTLLTYEKWLTCLFKLFFYCQTLQGLVMCYGCEYYKF